MNNDTTVLKPKQVDKHNMRLNAKNNNAYGTRQIISLVSKRKTISETEIVIITIELDCLIKTQDYANF